MQSKQTIYTLGSVLLTVVLAAPVSAAVSISPLASVDASPSPAWTTSWLPGTPTIIAVALLALPFGLCALRSIRKPRSR